MTEQDFNDEYVAGVLKSDAQDSSVQYSALGLQAFMPKRPNATARKPNTRFLSHLLRDTDAHNAALLAKEQREARERQRALKEKGEYIRSSQEDKFGRKHESRERPKKRRRPDDEHISHGEDHKRSRPDGEHTSRAEKHKRRRSRSPRRTEGGGRRHHRSRSRDRTHKHSERRRTSPNGKDRRRTSPDGKDRRRTSPDGKDRQRTSPDGKDPRRASHRSQRDRDRDGSSEGQSRWRSHGHTSKKEHHSSRGQRGRSPIAHRHYSPSPTSSDSDPLEAIVGPVQPPQTEPRGRGALRAASSSVIDSHFASNYNPSTDVGVPEPGLNDDWDMALEALRDRQKWTQAGAERLKAAGFTDSQVEKWKQSGTRGERNEGDVRWAKEGEGREWDRGKVIGSNNEIELRPDWGRLKDI